MHGSPVDTCSVAGPGGQSGPGIRLQEGDSDPEGVLNLPLPARLGARMQQR